MNCCERLSGQVAAPVNSIARSDLRGAKMPAQRTQEHDNTISLPPAVEAALKSQATKEGKPLSDYLESLVEEGSRRRDRIDLLAEKSFDEILAPFRRNVEQSGLSDEALDALFTEARKETSRVGRTNWSGRR